MHKKKMFGFLIIILISLILIQSINADLGKLEIKSKGKQWNVVHSTDKDFFVYIEDKNKQKTEICLLSKTAINPSELMPNKRIYNDNRELIVQLNRQVVRLEKNYYGYCRLIDTEEYLKFGEFSTIIEYQDINMIEYELDFANVNITLYKNISGNWNNTVNDIFVFYNQDSYKFGANDSGNEGVEIYKYKLESNVPILQNFYQFSISNPEIKFLNNINHFSYSEKHIFDFNDICNRIFEFNEHDFNVSSDCVFDSYSLEGKYYLEVIFKSDKNIDPLILVDEDSIHFDSILNNVTTEFNYSHLSLSDKSIVLYFPFDINSSLMAYDYSNYNNDGTKNNVIFINSPYKNAYSFNTQTLGSYIAVPFSQSLNFTGDFSVSLWAKTNQTRYGGLITNSIWITWANVSGWIIREETNGTLSASIGKNASGSPVTVHSLSSIADNKWKHIFANFDRDGFMTLYINGVQQNTALISSKQGEINFDFLITLGRNAYFGYEYFNGSIDEVMIYNRTLNTSEISGIYNNQSIRFFNEGTQTLNNQSYLNFSTENDRVNVTTTSELDNGMIKLSLGYYNGSWYYTPFQNLSGLNMFSINGNSTNLSLNFSFNSPLRFSTPLLKGDIGLFLWNQGTVSDLLYSTMVVNQYPYVDVNTTYLIKVYYQNESDIVKIDNAYLNLTIDGNVTQYNLTWNATTESFDTSLVFTEIEDYPFLIYGIDDIYLDIENITGTFLVREPYYITFRFWKVKDTDLDPYENDFGYVIVEPKRPNWAYNNALENFLVPLFFNETFKYEVYHAPYIDGDATVKLFEPNQYAVRFIDGIITFEDSFSKPEVFKSYGTNFFVEEYDFNGSDMTYDVYITEQDYDQYNWLGNMILIWGLVLIIVVSTFLFFVVPSMPQLSFIFGIGGTVMLIILRITIWFFQTF